MMKILPGNMCYYQRCQLLRITSSHYGKLQKFSIFYGLRKTWIFLRELKKKIALRNVAKKVLNKRIRFLMVQNFWDRSCFRVTPIILQGCHATWKTRKSQGIWKLNKKIRKKSWNSINLTDWQLSELHINVGSKMCVIRA